MNLKNARIKKLWDRGIRNPATIARKLGLPDEARVQEGLRWLRDTHQIATEPTSATTEPTQ